MTLKDLEPTLKPETQPNGSVVVSAATDAEARLALVNGLPFTKETRYNLKENPNGTFIAVPINGNVADVVLSGRNYALPTNPSFRRISR